MQAERSDALAFLAYDKRHVRLCFIEAEEDAARVFGALNAQSLGMKHDVR